MSIDFNSYFAGIVNAVSSKSNNKIKLGAIIVNSDNVLLSSGYNSFVRNCNDDPRKLFHEKSTYIEHAERNAIFNAAREGIRLKDTTLYCTWYPCVECARAIIQVGIKRVIALTKIEDCPIKWQKPLTRGKQLLMECKVNILYHQDNSILDNMIKPSESWKRE